jgi:hypothetical protein
MTETRRIEAIYGPFRGLLDVPADVAEQAIKDGWARDPFAPPSAADAPPPEPRTQEQLDKMIVAAEKAARKLRGEEEPKPKVKAEPKENPTTRQSTAAAEDEKATYKTRSSNTKDETKE